jgi:hypothetical protein
MIPDAHTPCAACPIVVRELYAVAVRVSAYVHVLPPGLGASLVEALAQLRPHVADHFANQDHSHSRELAGARGNPDTSSDPLEPR